ncbi:hypothetical protein T484DRAFT_1900312 [Baffinella frigidus]|nr:hypothetical protein T484DRAFT_1900312 [Cryptophyta sp. CCMP2293]
MRMEVQPLLSPEEWDLGRQRASAGAARRRLWLASIIACGLVSLLGYEVYRSLHLKTSGPAAPRTSLPSRSSAAAPPSHPHHAFHSIHGAGHGGVPSVAAPGHGKGWLAAAAEGGAGAVGAFFDGTATAEQLQDTHTSACEDAYEHVCGTFLKQRLPKDKDEWLFAFDGVKSRIEDRMRNLLSSNKGNAGRLYRACLDKESIDHAGAAPLAPYLEAVSLLQNASALGEAIAGLHRMNSKAFFTWSVGADADSRNQVMYLEQGGLTLPDTTAYLMESKAEQPLALAGLVARVMELAGTSPAAAAQKAASVVAVERALAEMHLTHADERKANSLPPLSISQVAAGMSEKGGLDWRAFFLSLGVAPSLVEGDEKVVRVLDVEYFQKLCAFLAKHPPAFFQPYLEWRALSVLIGHLSKPFQEADLAFRKKLFGLSKDPPRWRICLHTLNTYAPDTVGKVYVRDSGVRRGQEEKGAGGAGKTREGVLAMLGELREEMKGVLQEASWMSEQSRTVALDKLGGMLFEVGGPSQNKELGFTAGGSWFQDSVMMAQGLCSRQIQRMGTVLARDDWGGELGAMSVNAFYNVHANALFVPEALLRPPFLQKPSQDKKAGAGSASMSPSDFGALGGLLGHEMTHGFDNVGRLFTPALIIKNWWDASTVGAYKERAECIGEHYASYSVQGHHVSGNLTLGEDLADMGGLHLAYRAMLHHRRSRGGTTGTHLARAAKQEFFTAWAGTWCELATKQDAAQSIRTDPHAPARTRVNAALSWFPPFAEAFLCPAGSPMAARPPPACTLW